MIDVICHTMRVELALNHRWLCWVFKLMESMKPGACCIYTSSCISPLRNVLSMPIFCISHLYVKAKVKITQIIAGLNIGEKVSWKSKPYYWWNPLATNIALYLLTLPWGLSLNLKTHFQPMVLLWGGRVVRVHIPFLRSESYPFFIASTIQVEIMLV